MERPDSLRLGDPSSSKRSPSPSPIANVEKPSPDISETQEKYEEINEYIKEVDELLHFMKPFPKRVKVESSKPSLDHLENLIRLVEQLKDLRERNAQTQQRAEFLKDYRKIRDRRQRLLNEVASVPPPPPPPPPLPTDRKYRPSIPFRKSSRSKSVSSNEYDRVLSTERYDLQRKSLASPKSKVSKWTKVKEAFRWEKTSQLENRLKHHVKTDKKGEVHRTLDVAKAEESLQETSTRVSKVGLILTPGEKLDHSPNLIISKGQHEKMRDSSDPNNRLQVPTDRLGNSPSPADSVLSGHLSSCSSLGATSTSNLALPSSGYSGEHSSTGHSSSSVHLFDLPPPPPRILFKDDHISLSLQNISSSSEDENFEPLSFPPGDGGNQEESETRRSKSLDGETVLGPHPLLLQHSSKESLQDPLKSQKHKTPWGMVKDIIQTRKDSVKKKPKKKGELKTEGEHSIDSQPSEDLSTPEETSKDKLYRVFQRPTIEFSVEGSPEPCSSCSPVRYEGTMLRPFTPVLTLTLPSTEQLQKLAALETGEDGEEMGKLQDTESLDGKERSGSSSRWGKVKKAFMTSGSKPDDSNPQSGSAPSSPFHHGSFFSDIESDELSSGDWTDDRHGFENILETDTMTSALNAAYLQAEVQRNYAELQQKLAKDLVDDMQACELVKNLSKSIEKVERTDENDVIIKKPRESLTIPLPNVEDLSPDFKKKLDEWKKIKKGTPAVAVAKQEPQTHFISKIGEWQKWRPGSSSQKAETHLKEHHLQEEFYKKLEEWQMLKSGKRWSRSQSERGKDDEAPSPGLSRKNSKGRKEPNSGKSSASDSLSGSLRNKDARSDRKSQKEKDLQWLEKELQKIEREKIRLEREREKYLERQQRLEQMKRTMGTTSPTQEVLIQTATGFFRFEGISHKFTKKLYEWEKARGIGPEASTFALLETASVANKGGRGTPREERVTLQRSKSAGSVIESSSMTTQSIAHHPSSLSLNNVHDLETLEQATLLEASLASLEPDLDMNDEDEEPEAMIVDIEDVVEETAALMADEPSVLGQVPVYSYAPTEVTQLIDSSSGSDGEKDIQVHEVEVEENSVESAAATTDYINLLLSHPRNDGLHFNVENYSFDNKDNEMVGDVKEPVSKLSSELLLSNEGKTQKHTLLRQPEEEKTLMFTSADNFGVLHDKLSASATQNTVTDVYAISSDLLTLAERLETSLHERNSETKSSITCHRKQGFNKLYDGKAWYSTDEGSIRENDYPENQENKAEGITSQIKQKVMDLKDGLSRLKEAEVVEDTTESELTAPIEHEERSSLNENEAAFILPLRKHSRPSLQLATDNSETSSSFINKQRPSLKIVKESSSSPPPENLSPVTVTIRKPFHSPKENKIEKSKTQLLFSDGAEKIYDINSSARERRQTEDKRSPEVLKKKIKEKISELQRLTSEARPRLPHPEVSKAEEVGNEEENVVVVDRKASRTRPVLKTRRITDTNIAYLSREEDSDDVFVSNEPQIPELPGLTPSFVFVPTSRKIISPVQRDESSSVLSYVIDDVEAKQIPSPKVPLDEDTEKKSVTIDTPNPLEADGKSIALKKPIKIRQDAVDIGIPPLPNSPSTSRKFLHKDSSSPSIRNMIAKFSQKATEQEDSPSPTGWRSPVLERRIKEQLGKFEQDGAEALKHGGKFSRGIVQKSASAGLISGENKCMQSGSEPRGGQARGVLKSSSTGTIKQKKNGEIYRQQSQTVTSHSHSPEPNIPASIRSLKIKKAKAEFLSRGPSSQSWISEVSPSPSSALFTFSWRVPEKEDSASEEMKQRNRISHVSVGSESSFDETSYMDDMPNLIKSASAGMINVDKGEESRSPVNPIAHSSTEQSVSSKGYGFRSGLSNLKSKFRKVKMRKGKDKESAVSVLCRQSLLLDVSRVAKDVEKKGSTSKSCPSSPVFDRTKRKCEESKGWMKNPAKLFRSKEGKSSSDVTSVDSKTP